MTPFRLLNAFAACLIAAPAFAEEPAFLFDALQSRGSAYRASWDRLMKDVQPTPDWLVQFNRNFDGDSGNMAPVTIGGKPYAISFVCKPTDCASRKFVVMFDANGAHAFGALGGRGEPPEFFGAPSKDEQEAMAKGFSEAAPAALKP
jgi:hypothetical protein